MAKLYIFSKVFSLKIVAFALSISTGGFPEGEKMQRQTKQLSILRHFILLRPYHHHKNFPTAGTFPQNSRTFIRTQKTGSAYQGFTE